MAGSPVPQLIPPLAWRRPAFVWTPLALAFAIGGPALLFRNDGALMQLALIGGAAVFAIALISMGASWAFGRAPKTHREVIMHVLVAGAAVALAAPFVLARLLAVLADDSQAGESFTVAMSLSMAPLALVLGLPVAFASGVAFALIALCRPRPINQTDLRHNVQPFD